MVLRKGDTLRGGQYEIEAVLGQGGFGITYKAWDRNLKRWVVLKTPTERFGYDPDYERYVQLFREEGERMAKLAANDSNSHLVQVLDLFSEHAPDGASAVGHHYYLVMNFIEGKNLRDVVERQGRLSEEKVLMIAQQIGSALEWMHEHELVHRDAHPGNIMLRPNDKAVLIDLGGAKGFVPSYRSPRPTPGNKVFAPPEQMVPEETIRRPSADIFCFAGSLYFAVTGQRPASSLERKLSGVALTPPRQLVSISEELDQMLMAGLKLEAVDRPQNIQEFLAYLQPKPIFSPKTPLPSPSTNPLKNTPPSPPPNWVETQDRAKKAAFLPAIIQGLVPPLSPNWVEMQDRAKKAAFLPAIIQGLVPPLSPNRPPPQPQPQPNIKDSRQRRKTEIAWGWLVGCVIAYTLVGIGVSAGAHNTTKTILALLWTLLWAPLWVWGATKEDDSPDWPGYTFLLVTFAWAVTSGLSGLLACSVCGSVIASSDDWTKNRTVAVVGILAVVGVGMCLWRGSWDLIIEGEALFLPLWWGAWPPTLGLVPVLAAQRMSTSGAKTIALPTIASWVGLALGVFIYRAVHPA